MEEIKLRDYQVRLVEKSREALKRNKHIIVQAATGAGKTLCFSYLAKLSTQKGKKIVILSNRVELLIQSEGSLRRLGVEAEYISPSHKKVPTGNCIVAMAQTLRARFGKPEWKEFLKSVDTVVIDECFRGDVEILTDKGFVRFDELKGNEIVAQFSNDSTISFVRPIRYIKKEYDDLICKVYIGRGKFIYMTPNHNQVYKTKNINEYKIKPIKDLSFNSAITVPVSGYGTGYNETLSNMERVFIAIQADGIFQSSQPNYDTYSIQLTRDRKIDRFISFLNGIDAHEIKTNRPKTKRWMVKLPKGNAKLLRTNFDINMGYNRACDFIEEVLKWDGCEKMGNTKYYSSTIEDNVDVVSAIAIQAGFKAYKSFQEDKHKESYKKVYRLYLYKTLDASTSMFSLKYEAFKGTVYCVEVPEHKIVVRSEGKVIITGNCHMQDANYLLESGLLNDKFVLGFTATPRRGGKQRQLGLDFAEIVDAVTTQDLIDGGYLVPAVHYTLDAPDLSKLTEINPITGDYNETSMAALFDNPKMYAGVIENYKALTPDTKAIVFCCNQTHAIQTCLEFEKAGISARFLVSGLKKTDKGYDLFKNNQHLTGKRKTIVDEFGQGKFQVLCNASILTTGFDCPSIETVIVNRATQSLALALQMYGRGGRPYPGKDHFNILDFGDNVKRHGAYELERKWSIWHDTKDGGGVAMTKECPIDEKDNRGKTGCGRLIHIGYSECPFCGYIFKTPEELRIVELSKIVDGFELKDMTPKQLVAYAELKHYNKYWVIRQLFYGAEDRRQFVAAMKQLGYDYKFIYRTYDEYRKKK